MVLHVYITVINILRHNHYAEGLIFDDCSIRVYLLAMATELQFM